MKTKRVRRRQSGLNRVGKDIKLIRIETSRIFKNYEKLT